MVDSNIAATVAAIAATSKVMVGSILGEPRVAPCTVRDFRRPAAAVTFVRKYPTRSRIEATPGSERGRGHGFT
jgi:hypothetical protein